MNLGLGSPSWMSASDCSDFWIYFRGPKNKKLLFLYFIIIITLIYFRDEPIKNKKHDKGTDDYGPFA